METLILMIAIFIVILSVLSLASLSLTRVSNGMWLPDSNNENKRQFEIYAIKYSVVWIIIFGYVVVSEIWRSFTASDYMSLCVTLSLPFLLQPIVYPFGTEKNLPLYMRYSFKANVWIAIFSFIGNYWYTHYFYSVLGARYTFPSHRLNDVPIALYFATHFYFMFYHTMSNLLLRKIRTTYANNTSRLIFTCLTIAAFSYFTAFMETLTISNFDYYSFRDKNMVYVVGSAFYGLYFIVSYPMFYNLDSDRTPTTIISVIMEALGSSMLVLLLLDFCRLYFGIRLNITGITIYNNNNNNNTNTTTTTTTKGKGYYLYKP